MSVAAGRDLVATNAKKGEQPIRSSGDFMSSIEIKVEKLNIEYN